MGKIFYVDTSVWRDYLEDRGNGIRPLGELAFQFLKKCRKDKAIVIVSDIVLKELEIFLSNEQTQILFSDFSDIIFEVTHTKKQADEAYELLKKFKRGFPLADILHSIIARDEQAVLVTCDKHFRDLDIAEVRAPEELL